MIKPKQKMKIVNGRLAIEPSLVKFAFALRRWWNLDSREITVDRIKQVVNQTVQIVSELKDDDIQLIKFITVFDSVINGLTNLTETYQDDALVVASLKVYNDKIKAMQKNIN